jgi:predicted ATPase
MFDRIRIENFSAFPKLSIKFSPGINAIIGENGTGKTHLLKLLYALKLSSGSSGNRLPLEISLPRIFRPAGGDSRRLIRHGSGRTKVSASALNHQHWAFEIGNENEGLSSESQSDDGDSFPVFIPAKEILSHAKGFRSLYEKSNIPFDQTYKDLLDLAFFPESREIESETLWKLKELISEKIGGNVVEKSDEFYLVTETGELEMQFVAEGLRKLSLLWLLIQNNKILEGKMLFWDEPEANLNPSLMPVVVDVLLALEKMGVQIFIASHSYPLLKALDLRRGNETEISFHSLYFTPSGNLKIETKADYLSLKNNKISEQYLRLYDDEIERALGDRNE